MIGDLPHWKLPKTLLTLQNPYKSTTATSPMEAQVRRTGFSPLRTTKGSSMATNTHREHYRDYHRSFSNGNSGKKAMSKRSSYFSLESLFLLVCLTASLLILPLILPPLPPPPFLLLLLPIAILVLLMILAVIKFMPF